MMKNDELFLPYPPSRVFPQDLVHSRDVFVLENTLTVFDSFCLYDISREIPILIDEFENFLSFNLRNFSLSNVFVFHCSCPSDVQKNPLSWHKESEERNLDSEHPRMNWLPFSSLLFSISY